MFTVRTIRGELAKDTRLVLALVYDVMRLNLEMYAAPWYGARLVVGDVTPRDVTGLLRR